MERSHGFVRDVIFRFSRSSLLQRFTNQSMRERRVSMPLADKMIGVKLECGALGFTHADTSIPPVEGPVST